METQRYRCLVVDDEPIARKIIVNYMEQLPILELAAESINAISAIEQLGAQANIHIIFLDINMPNLSGLQLVKILQPHQPVIFTTAYSEHAVESYELNAVDYLLKPFSFERFSKAVYKAVDFIGKARAGTQEHGAEQGKPFFIKSDGKNYPVAIDDILYCEAMKNYTRVVLKNGQKLMPLVPLSRFETSLQEGGGDFIRTHRSFLVARKHIAAVTPNYVIIQEFEVPIGVLFKESFFRTIGMKANG